MLNQVWFSYKIEKNDKCTAKLTAYTQGEFLLAMSASSIFFLISLYFFAIPRREVTFLHRLLPLLAIVKTVSALQTVYQHTKCPWT